MPFFTPSGVYEEEEGAAHLTPAGRARLAQFDALLQGGDPGEVLPSANGYHRPAPIMGIAGNRYITAMHFA